MPSSSKLRAAVVGLAGIGRTHVNRLQEHPEADLVAVCDLVPEVRAEMAQRAGVPGYADLSSLLEAVEADAVFLCTPPKSHRPLTELAAERGVHVFCEKPMASTVADCQAMIDTCARHGVTLMIGHKKRYFSAVRRLKELLAGELGPADFLLARYPHPGRTEKEWFWAEEDGGGPLLENAVHEADLLRWLGGEVEHVWAEGSTAYFPHRAPQFNCAAIVLRFQSGAIGTLGAGMVGLPALSLEDIFVTTQRGVAEVSGQFDHPDTLRYAFRDRPNEVHTETFPGEDAFRLEIDHFFHCLRTGEEPLTSGYEGLKAVELCRAWKLAAEQEEVVGLDPERSER
ncbi:MAG TPA: Gfo/Idh/MocA family oxidoreductase [Armatimonadetes bacterium]|nr:Gfo/Idh/MocA family oxidoreductase [Armatimonadota bacterium]